MAHPQNEAELMALHQFKMAVKDLDIGNGILMRFLRARSLDCTKAEEMLRKHLVWQKEAEMNQLENWTPHEKLYQFDSYFCGVDQEDRLVIQIPYGEWPLLRDYVEKYNGTELDMLRFLSKFINLYYRCMLRTKHQQVIAIIDVEGLTFSKVFSECRRLKTIQLLTQMSKELDDNFPEILSAAFIINTPKYFMWIWRFIGPYISARTNSKIYFFGSKEGDCEQWKAALFNSLPEATIPEKYGGKAKPTLVFDENLEKIVLSSIVNLKEIN